MNTLESWPDNPFWDFSIDFYGRDGVEERLLLLQEKLLFDSLFLKIYKVGKQYFAFHLILGLMEELK